jgi:hypothetical protein
MVLSIESSAWCRAASMELLRRLESGKALGDREKLLAHGGQMLKAFPQAEAGEVIGADLITQEG